MNRPQETGFDFPISLVSANGDEPIPEKVNDINTTNLDEIFSMVDEDGDAIELDRQTAMTNFVMEHDHFGLDTKQANITTWLVEMLVTIEDSKQQFAPEFDMTRVNPEALRPIVQQWRANYEELAIKTESLRREELLQAYMIAYAGQPTSEIFTALGGKQELPEAIQLKSAAYAQMISPDIVKSKTDRATMAEKIDQYTLTNAPAPYWFVLSEIMSDENLSQKTKTAIAKEFSLDPQTVSGASLSSALNEKVTDDEESLQGENKPIILGDGFEAKMAETGQLIVTVEGDEDPIEFIFAPDETPKEIGIVLSLVKLWRVIGDDTFFGVEINPHSAIMKGVNRLDLYRIQRIFEATLGGQASYNDEILTDDLVDDLASLNSFVSEGHNADELNIFAGDTNYAVNVERLAAVSLYLRNHPNTANGNIEALQDHLTLVCDQEAGLDADNEEPTAEEDTISEAA